ncbi:DJ-1/PfpI family protein [Colletotrichum graminicola]|uniref:DJ-1/PfpI family protein n=1 Tax=Colletotrichum graminicola (strain M1.001 / M2 / FGSC 10212) TaxID=645133 RepID=E3QYQ9_COLGM|nr:DJ-1/PfpI family protein [Colletotrichum graminicola M1.001]EFQ35997.1 DJ-1/PfpI family protein [Colletotrichum graminicola M1.001]WDK17156.1 DJ-1/PfpI family protein [Colletotrichum graminicola]
MLEAVQLGDIVGIDMFGNLSRKYYNKVKDYDPEFAQWADPPIEMDFFYISSTLAPAEMTPGLKFVPNVTYDDCPRDLDLVLIGGPMPDHRPPSADRFMKEAFPKTKVWLTTCTGSLWLASAGVLKGKIATTNRELLKFARETHPETEWLDKRWVVEEKEYEGEGKGELWTAGGAGASLSMIIKYLNKNFDPGFVQKLGIDVIAFEELALNQFYKTSR